MKFGVLTLLWIFYVGNLSAQTIPFQNPECIQGDPKNRSLHDFVTQVEEQNPFLLGWQQEQAFQNSDYQKLRKAHQSCSPHSKTNWVQIKSKIAPRKITTECIEASLKREPNNKGSLCQEEFSTQRINIGRANENGPCITSKVRDYLAWSTNAAIDCMSTDENTIDPRFIFILINNESAFHFYQQYSSGKGLGQLTTDAVKEIFEHKDEFLEPILKSSKKSCQPFQAVAKRTLDLEKIKGTSISLFDKNDNMRICPFIHPSEGLARSQIFAIAKYQRSLQKSKTLVEKHLKHLNAEDRQSLAGIMALDFYGPENKVNNIETIRELKGLNLKNSLIHLKNKSQYIRVSLIKLNEATGKIKMKPEEHSDLGKICVE